MEACREDPLFFIATFGWLQEVRPKAIWKEDDLYHGETTIPFIPRGYQAKAIKRAVGALGVTDIIVPKSRETGITWIFIALAVWDWRFNGAHIGFVSRDEDSVDTSQGSDSLLGKFQFFLDRLPKWIGCVSGTDYTRNLTNHSFTHHDSGGNLTGLASGPDIFRGARKKWVLFDEAHFFPKESDYLARDSLIGVTFCRVMVSTLNRSRGASGAFWDAWEDATAESEIIEIDWKEDTDKARGLYTSENGRLEILDKEMWTQYKNSDGGYFHPYRDGNYEFILDGVTRSLYYDYEGSRPGVNRQTLAAELDRDITGATAQLCDAKVLKAAKERTQAPLLQGIFVETDDEFVWTPDWGLGKDAELWLDLVDGRPPKGDYAMGADISAGTGGSWSSYSCLVVFDRLTGEQVFSWRSNTMNPLTFASLARFVGDWFHDAYFVPEINGPLGQLFIERLVRMGYGRLYMQRRGKKSYADRTQSPGYWNGDGGAELLTNLESGIKSGSAKVQSSLCLTEMGRYFYKGGVLVQTNAQTSEDEGARGKSHGDMAIATSTAWWGVTDLPLERDKPKEVVTPEGSFLWRQERARDASQPQDRSYWRDWK